MGLRFRRLRLPPGKSGGIVSLGGRGVIRSKLGKTVTLRLSGREVVLAVAVAIFAAIAVVALILVAAI